MNKMSAEEIGTFVLDFIPYALDDVIDFIASLLGVPPGKPEEKLKDKETNAGTIRDPGVFPAPAIVDVIGALIEHEDVVSFFASVRKVASSQALKNLTARLSERSMQSKRVTAGQTSKS